MTKSRLVLGTAQLGMDYGVNNVRGAPTKEEVFSILDEAFTGDINTFDTAPAYGSAETVLGEWIQARGISEKVHVISKVSGNSRIETSLARLHIKRMDGYLLHTPQDLYDEETVASLRAAKETGLTNHIGVSVYNPQDALHAVELDLDYIQVPYNVLDQRLDRVDFFERAKAKKVTIFARSPFLQGLLLMQPENLPPHLSHARAYLERFIGISHAHGLSQLEAALIFTLHSRADHIVFGTEAKEQLTEILSIARYADTFASDLIEEMRESFRDVDEAVVNPSIWKKN